MAKKTGGRDRRDKPRMDYNAQLKKLRQEGPRRVYILWGEEDYLRDSYLAELKKLCLAEGTEAFNYHRLQGPVPEMEKLAESTEAMPFMGERTLTEVRDFDASRTSAYDPEALKRLLEDVPEWATVAFVYDPGQEPDGRLAAVKAMKKVGVDLEFTSPGDDALVRWVIRRVKDQDKDIDLATASYLIWVCGARMNALIPEITKVAGYARGASVTKADIDAVAKKAPETTVFDLTNALGARRYDDAAGLLADLLADKDERPQGVIAMVSNQFRQLYIARVALDSGQGDGLITACAPELAGNPKRVAAVKRVAANFSTERLARAVSMCAGCDYAMKDTGGDDAILLKQLLLQLALDRA